MAAIVRSVMVRCLCIVCLTILAVCARADPDATLPLSNDAAIVLKKAATLNEIARALYPNNREARDDYRERLARANPQVFTKAGQVRSVTLPAGTRLQIPAGTLIPPAQFVAAVEALRAPVASAAVAPNSGAVQPSAPQSGAVHRAVSPRP